MAYTPFNKKHIDELDESDLQTLVSNEVAEGYWVEYKSQFQNNKKTAKSIASFANTYGGWYFIGVDADKEKNVAKNICGISLKDTPNPIDKLRETVKSHIDPVPVFYFKLVSLESGNVVLVVQIPTEQETPFINLDGRIYRRIGDSSDPIHETDRYSIDKLVENGRKQREKFLHFCQDERTFSQAEENAGWVNIFLSPYPVVNRIGLGIGEKTPGELALQAKKLSQKTLKIRLEGGEEYGTANIPFDNTQMTNRSIILRQIESVDLAYNSLQVELFFDGRAKISIPLPYRNMWLEENSSSISSSKVKDVLISLTQENRGGEILQLMEIEHLWSVVSTLVSYYEKWIEQEFPESKMYINEYKLGLSLNNVWRNVAFLDADEWADYVKESGLPIIYKNDIEFPAPFEHEFRVQAELESSPLWIVVNYILCSEFGIPTNLYGSLINTARKRYSNLSDA